MLREKLNRAVRRAAETEGYTPYVGFQYRMQGEITRFPAAWMLPPQMVRAEGRYEGTLTYRVTLYLMKPDKKYDGPQKEKLWDDMETDALRMAETVRVAEGVHLAEVVSAEPAERTLSRHGELSLKALFEIRMSFCNNLIGSSWK